MVQTRSSGKPRPTTRQPKTTKASKKPPSTPRSARALPKSSQLPPLPTPQRSTGSEDPLLTTPAERKNGLPRHVLRSLAFDIEERGGIAAFRNQSGNRTQHLCDANPLVYGGTGDPKRRQLTQQVDRWCRLSNDQYNSRVRLRYGIFTGVDANQPRRIDFSDSEQESEREDEQEEEEEEEDDEQESVKSEKEIEEPAKRDQTPPPVLKRFVKEEPKSMAPKFCKY